MEDGSVVEPIFRLFTAERVLPFALAFRKLNKILHGFGRVFFKQAACDCAFSSIENSVGSGLPGHGAPLLLIFYCFGAVAGFAVGFFATGLRCVVPAAL